MKINSLINKKVAVLGGGKEGASLIIFLTQHKVRDITICDKKEKKELNDVFKTIPNYVKKQLGKTYLDNLSDFDVVFRSPGIPFNEPKIQKAIEEGVEFSSQTKLFFDNCPSKIIGITGTKGKGTTSSLLYDMILSSRKVYLGGNIGKPMLEFLNDSKKDEIVILELSSFQLQDLKVSPSIFVVLNIFCDHLDVHKSFKEYQQAKLHILNLQKSNDISIIHESLSGIIGNIKSKFYIFGKNSDNLSAKVDKKKILITLNNNEVVIDCDKAMLVGFHNLLNIAAASITALLLGIKKEEIQKTIDSFRPLPHRLELIKKINKVSYYNDSLATIPEGVIAAIKSFRNPKILIVGGKSKGSNFSGVAQEIAKNNIKYVLVIGESTKEIRVAMDRFAPNIKYNVCRILKDAVEFSNKIATSGDIVMLSPGYASFDMFKSYKERGEKFKEYVNGLDNA